MSGSILLYFLKGDNTLILIPSDRFRNSFSPLPELASRWVEYSLLWRMSLYIFDILFLSPWMFNI